MRAAEVLSILHPVGLALEPAYTGLVVAYLYVCTAPLGVLTAPIRARVFGPDAVAPPRTRQRSVFLGMVEEDPASAT